ncbi:MAG: hypothetical protein HY329_27795 [Chloroflexi bacterium]|nr:hypothetical protein [Chloroflexota bacterium]
MRVDFAFLCREVEETDRAYDAFSVGIDSFASTAVPAMPPTFALFGRLRANEVEASPADVVVRITNADGGPIHEATFEVQLTRLASGGGQIAYFRCYFDHVSFPHHGDYGVHLIVNGAELHRSILTILRPPAGP